MMMFEFISQNLLWTEGFNILFISAIMILFGLIKWRPLIFVGFFVFLFSFYFFRNPIRTCPIVKENSSVIVCPADGKVVDIATGDFDGYTKKVSIFLSVFDVHVNRTPIGGVVKDVTYKPGKFMLAFLPKSSELNERNDVTIVDDNKNSLIVRQIAGTIARKICCWTKPGDRVSSGRAYGMIKFGSRVDVLLPQNVVIELKKGQRVYAGQTVLGRFISSNIG